MAVASRDVVSGCFRCSLAGGGLAADRWGDREDAGGGTKSPVMGWALTIVMSGLAPGFGDASLEYLGEVVAMVALRARREGDDVIIPAGGGLTAGGLEGLTGGGLETPPLVAAAAGAGGGAFVPRLFPPLPPPPAAAAGEEDSRPFFSVEDLPA